MNYVYTVLGTTVAIIVAEIVFNYGLGDKVKDLFLSVDSRIMGLEAKLMKLKVKAKM